MNKKNKIFDIVIYSFVVATTLLYILQLDYRNTNIVVIITFLLIGIISFFSIISKGIDINIYNTVHIFVYVFFFIAPMQQYTEGIVLWQGNGLVLKYTDKDYFYANLMILIFLILFNISYKFSKFKRKENSAVKTIFYLEYLPIDKKVILTLISTLAFVIIVVTGNLTERTTSISDNTNLNAQIINILRYFPVCSFIVYGIYYKKFSMMIKQKSFWIIFLQIVLIFFPFWGHIPRYFLFGTYILILAVLFSNSQKNRTWYFLVLYIGFALFFSSLRYATSIEFDMEKFIDFSHADFDAYQMLMALMRYTDEYGIVYGKNILSAFAFLIPRNIWPGKMLSSGAIVASHYGSWFENVSSPLVAELYFAFGWFGIVIGAVFLGKLVRKMDSFQDSVSLWQRGLFCIFTGMTIYIMRGSLLATMAFSLGLVLSLIFMCFVSTVRFRRPV